MPTYESWFRCASGCEGRFEVTEIVYRCPTCSGLLEVAHDVDSLKRRSPAAWMRLFDERYMRTQFPYGSGVWGKKELVFPGIDDANVVSLYEGGTNLHRAVRFGESLGLEDLWIKQCGSSHTGSFKDLGMTVLVSAVKEIISSGGNVDAVVCASTGDTSASVAAYCAAAGIPAVVVLPKDKVTPAQLIQPTSKRSTDARVGHRLRRVHGGRGTAQPGQALLSGQLGEPAAHRGAEDDQPGDRAAVRPGRFPTG